MDTKSKADIAESAVATELLRRNFRVLKPVGDRLPYDLGIDIDGKLVKIQVKSAWKRGDVYLVDSRRTKTNRRRMIHSRYEAGDFDFAILHIDDLSTFYIVPHKIFCSYRSEITLSGKVSRQRPPRSGQYREAWGFLNSCRTP